MTDAVTIYKGAGDYIRTGGQSIIAAYAGCLGGVIANPSSATDQNIFLKQPVQVLGPLILHGPFDSYTFNQNQFNQIYKSRQVTTEYQYIPTIEPLFIDLTGPAALQETATTIRLDPGQSFNIPAGQTKDVWVNAATTGHRFSAFIIQTPTQTPQPVPGNFPPTGPTSMTKTIKSYLYQQYTDDDDLQDFVDSYNLMTQDYIDTFNDINLPIYTGPLIVGKLLDWVAQGLYGLPRPALSTGKSRIVGPFDTYQYDVLELNQRKRLASGEIIVTSDDTYKRILTWHFFKGDGKVFNIRWLKRRIKRFLYGVNGVNTDTSTTYDISITFPAKHQVQIVITPPGSHDAANIFQECVVSGAVELPFQLVYNVIVTP